MSQNISGITPSYIIQRKKRHSMEYMGCFPHQCIFNLNREKKHKLFKSSSSNIFIKLPYLIYYYLLKTRAGPDLWVQLDLIGAHSPLFNMRAPQHQKWN